MTSFEEILNRPSGEIKPPEALPVGTYHCLVDGVPEAGKSSQKGTDYLRFKFKILSPMQDVDAKAAQEQQVNGKIITNDYYATAAWRLTEMLVEHLGLDDDQGNKKTGELVSEAPGRQLLVKLKHDISPDGRRRFHRVDSTAKV